MLFRELRNGGEIGIQQDQLGGKMAKRASKPVGKARKPDRVNGNSLSPQKELSEVLKSRFPEVFVEGKIDGDKLRQSLGEDLDTNNERYGLSWAGKAECFRHIQETTTSTLKPGRGQSVDFDKTENMFIEGDNLEVLKILQKTYQNKIKMIYIDPPYNTGNDSFIYPDRYKEEKEDYELRAGIKDAEGLLTKDGFWRKNSKDAGHFHSNWLSMMYPRLFLAKNLLRDDGVIFVSIDDNEVYNLRMIMNEIFGEENFVANIVWENKEGGGGSDSKYFRIKHEYITCYARNIENLIINGVPITNADRYTLSDEYVGERGKYYLQKLNQASIQYSSSLDYPVNAPDGTEIYPKQVDKKACWRWSKKKLDWGIKKKFVEFKKDSTGQWQLYSKQYMNVDKEGKPFERTNRPTGVIEEFSSTLASKQLENILASGIFNYPKPYQLIQFLLSLILDSTNDDIVLDFFAGSCTSAHAVMKLNAKDGRKRKFICVQLAEPCEEESEAFKAGFKTIADIGKERIRRAAKKIKKEMEGNLKFDKNRLDLGFKVFRLEESNFKQWRENVKTGEELKEQMRMFVHNVKKGAGSEDMLFEIILKNSRFDLNVKIEKESFDGVDYYLLATEDREGTEKIKAVSGNKRIHHEEKEGHEGKTNANEIICLDLKITKKFVDKVLAEKPERFTCLDIGFKNNDQLKTNTALQMESGKIEFKVI